MLNPEMYFQSFPTIKKHLPRLLNPSTRVLSTITPCDLALSMSYLSYVASLKEVVSFHSYRRVAVEVDGVKVEEMKVERF